MAIYLSAFLTSTVIFYSYEKCNKKGIKNVLILIAVLIPCLLAGLRDISIGTDTNGYVRTLFETAKQSNSIFEYYKSTFFHEWRNIPVASFDIAYTFLAYISAFFFRTLASFLFLTELLIIVPIIASLILYKKYFDISLPFSMLFFYLFYYNTTYNAVRQWLSIGFAFLAVAHLCTDRNSRKIILFALISTLFHKTGSLAVLLIVFYFIINNVRGKSVKFGAFKLNKDKVKVIKIILLSLIMLVSMSTVIVPILSGVGLTRYTGYIVGDVVFSVNQMIYQIPFLIVIFMRKKYLLDKNGTSLLLNRFKLFTLCIFFINTVLSQLATSTENAWRVMLIFGLFNIVFFSFLYKNESSKTRRVVIMTLLIIYLLIYWLFTFVILGRHGTVPYVFA